MSEPVLRYDFVSRLIHVVMAVTIIALLVLGLYMADLEPSPAKWQIYGIHKGVGMLALALIALRIIWRSTHKAPPPLSTHKLIEQRLARAVHLALYAAMVVLPISGYVMSSAGGHPIRFLGLFDVPLLIPKNEDLGEGAKEIHEIAANFMIGAIMLHVGGAVKHHFIDRDGTLRRMFG